VQHPAEGGARRLRPARVEELVRWLFRRTGEELVAELGSYQLDACSILLKAAPSGYARHAVQSEGRLRRRGHVAFHRRARGGRSFS
jgi:hypothetical protein